MAGLIVSCSAQISFANTEQLSATNNAMSSAYECTQVGLDQIDPALLTKEERIALLDNNLNKSIDNFSTCVSSAQASMAGGGNGQGLGGDEGFVTGEGAQSDSNEPMPQSEDVGDESTDVNQEINSQIPTKGGESGSTPTTRGIIPPKDNDKIICKLLFQEIKKTTDTAMIEGLKEQYSNYKCG